MWTLILSTFLYACESWTLTAELEGRIQALEMRFYKRLLNDSYKEQVANEKVRSRFQNAIGVHDDLLTMVEKRTTSQDLLAWQRQFCSERSKKERRAKKEMGG